MNRTMPAQKPHRSEQTVCTPPEFLRAVRRKLDIKQFSIDLAATKENAVVPNHFSPGGHFDAMKQPWRPFIPDGTYAWLNPPYSNIRPWVEKALICGRNIAMLVPASVGSNWWRDYVHEQATVLFLNGRITFVGHKAGYPKDLALLLYGKPANTAFYDVWTWRNQ